jgi:hypothetical protein
VEVDDMNQPCTTLLALAPFLLAIQCSSEPGGDGSGNNAAGLDSKGSSAGYPVPPDSGVIDVTKAPTRSACNWGCPVAVPGNDSTKAFQCAIQQCLGTTPATRDHVIYAPKGTYLLSQQLVWNDGTFPQAYLGLLGEEMSATILKLVDNAAAFQDRVKPLALISTSSGGDAKHPDGAPGTAFRNDIRNITIDTGSGNPGAIGIDWFANNSSTMSDVAILSGDGQGSAGLRMERFMVGPDLMKNITVQGFDVGIQTGGEGAWMEGITLIDQNKVGLEHIPIGDTPGSQPYASSIAVRHLTSTQTHADVPAIQVDTWVLSLGVVDSTLRGPSGSTGPAIRQATDGQQTFTFLRNVDHSGYAHLVDDQSPSSSEWTSLKPLALSSQTKLHSLDLTIEETPTYYDANLEHWIAPGPPATDSKGCHDSRAAIQAAIDAVNTSSTLTTVYLPWATYSISDTIKIHGDVKAIESFGATITPCSDFPVGHPAIQFLDDSFGGSGPVFVDGLRFAADTPNYPDNGFDQLKEYIVEHTSSRPFVITRSDDMSFLGAPGAGTTYLESVAFGPFEFHNKAFARNLDPEVGPAHVGTNSTVHVTVDGGTLWALGLKTEGQSPLVEVKNGGAVEVLGLQVSLVENFPAAENPVKPAYPMLINAGSKLSVADYAVGPGDFYYNVNEQLGTDTTRFLCGAHVSGLGPCDQHAYANRNASSVPLYVGY